MPDQKFKVGGFISMITLAGLAVFSLAIIARLLPGARTIDDAYITFRYARNILAGFGLVFNPGEHVLGTTTPLYALLLAGLGSLHGGTAAPFPQIALLVNALADGLVCILLIDLGRRFGSTCAGLGAALAWAVAPYSVTFAIGGLETSLYVLLLIGTFWSHLNGHRRIEGLLAVMLLLTRPDGLLFLLPLGLDIFFQALPPGYSDRVLRIIRPVGPALPMPAPGNPAAGKRWIMPALLFICPLLAWALFAIWYYGSPIPHSIAAKSLVYRLGPEAALIRLLQHFATPFMDQESFGIPGIMIGFVLYPLLFGIGAYTILRVRQVKSAWPWIAYPWLYFAAFAIANPLIFRWYLTPPLPAYILTILIGADQLLISLFKNFSGRHGRAAQAAVQTLLVILLPATLYLNAWRWHPDHGLSNPAPDMAWYQLELLYHQAADLLSAEIGPHPARLPTLAAGDVGVLGYFTPARILDTVGLNSTQSLRYYPLDPSYYVINYAIPPDLILNEKPDFLVILEVYGRAGLLKDSRFWQAYQLKHKISTDIYGSDGLLIFERKGPP